MALLPLPAKTVTVTGDDMAMRQTLLFVLSATYMYALAESIASPRGPENCAEVHARSVVEVAVVPPPQKVVIIFAESTLRMRLAPDSLKYTFPDVSTSTSSGDCRLEELATTDSPARAYAPFPAMVVTVCEEMVAFLTQLLLSSTNTRLPSLSMRMPKRLLMAIDEKGPEETKELVEPVPMYLVTVPETHVSASNETLETVYTVRRHGTGEKITHTHTQSPS